MSTKAYAAHSAGQKLAPFALQRRAVGPEDVRIDILHCGVCHSDLHTVRGDWPGIRFPVVPGHEIVGRVAAVGDSVSRFRPGDIAGVGCMVGSCLRCDSCCEGLEQYCDHGFVQTYGGNIFGGGETTYGGYATDIVVDQRFVLSVTHKGDLAGVAPLLCAGITCWSPLRRWRAGPGSRVGVVGIGGLGHMGVKLAAALGAHVVAFTSSEGKRREALSLGAHEVAVSRYPEEMRAHANSLDLLLDTVAAPHDLDTYSQLLKRDGTMVLVGIPERPHPPIGVVNLIIKRRAIAGSAFGGIAETQEMLDFCAERNITADVEPISIQDVETAYERLQRSDVRYRFVIDIASLRDELLHAWRS
ncbi:NAD(P)-dependent alcohol dehydrogenase [Enterovirga aerilata]|uniref:NAD(P)-dependent alcohol dehydrogenase n=1 Tax=Enterovirga aerilata TaxID=2730920 RepID=A0A849I2P0_9HYPH|nr:NAD(P)-dependent alcohol dehydrogenase [Enterovirga sp. DB1703]NNM71621.1 NAD(P)-dependent alcohol dehydrogenase [Enterovirga sp. DB1703]